MDDGRESDDTGLDTSATSHAEALAEQLLQANVVIEGLSSECDRLFKIVRKLLDSSGAECRADGSSADADYNAYVEGFLRAAAKAEATVANGERKCPSVASFDQTCGCTEKAHPCTLLGNQLSGDSKPLLARLRNWKNGERGNEQSNDPEKGCTEMGNSLDGSSCGESSDSSGSVGTREFSAMNGVGAASPNACANSQEHTAPAVISAPQRRASVPALPLGRGKGKGKGKTAVGYAPLGRKWHCRTIFIETGDGTIFEKALAGECELAPGANWRIDESVLRSVFDAGDVTPRTRVSLIADHVTIFGSQRAQNLSIGIKGLQTKCKLEIDEVAAALNALDMDSAVFHNPEVIESLALVVPTPDETELLSEVIELERHRLRDVERNLWPLARVPRLPQRLRATLFARKSRSVEADLLGRMDQMRRAVGSALNSVALCQFIGVCVSMGNFVNHGFIICSAEAQCGPPIRGFRLEGVPKLAREFKATSNGINLLHIILLHLGRHLQDAPGLDEQTAEGLDEQTEVAVKKDALRNRTRPRTFRSTTRASARKPSPPPHARHPDNSPMSPCFGVREVNEQCVLAPRTRVRKVANKQKKKCTTPTGYFALKRWLARLKRELGDVRVAAKSTLADIEDHVAELLGEMSWVEREAQLHTEAYDSSCAASLLHLAACLPERRAKILEELEDVKATCIRFCHYFGETLRPELRSLSETTHGLLATLAEVVWDLLECAVTDLCLSRFQTALPAPESLALTGFVAE
jgi:hypothetical protein